MTNELNFKELYQVSLTTTYSIEVGDNTFEPGETVAAFDKIQIANFQEIKNSTSARGGFGNRGLVFWDSTREIKISFSQGVFSKTQYALMSNAQLFEGTGNEVCSVNTRRVFESDENSNIVIEHIFSNNKPIFVYDLKSGKKITDYILDNGIIHLKEPYQSVIVDYWYDYNNGYTTLRVGKPLTTGFLSLTGKMRVKDDTTGKVVTGIINIPKLRLMSDLSMRVGSDAIPQVGRIDAVAVPEGVRGQTKVMEIIFLNDDIDADM
jgi:hypothetical protein